MDLNLEQLEQEAIKESIFHYEKMKVWVYTQDLKERPSPFKMRRELGVTWFSNFCSLCDYSEYVSVLTPNPSNTDGYCGYCPLRVRHGACSDLISPWRALSKAETWSHWIIKADELLVQLKTLLNSE